MYSLPPKPLNNLVLFNNKDSRTIVFVDSNLPDCEQIVQQVVSEARAIIIGSEDDGIVEISRLLDSSSCSEVHIFASGFPGCVYLGNSELSFDTLKTYQPSLENWFLNNSAKKHASASLYLYCRNLDMGKTGNKFVAQLSQITQAEIHTFSSSLNSNILIG
ncbi:MAG: DUF4347 domain-containing protein [Cyanobacteria bacterium P01_G01_bin.19]